MTDAYLPESIELHDLAPYDTTGATWVYRCEYLGSPLFFEVVAEPSARELLDAALVAVRAEQALLAQEARARVDGGAV